MLSKLSASGGVLRPVSANEVASTKMLLDVHSDFPSAGLGNLDIPNVFQVDQIAHALEKPPCSALPVAVPVCQVEALDCRHNPWNSRSSRTHEAMKALN